MRDKAIEDVKRKVKVTKINELEAQLEEYEKEMRRLEKFIQELI